VPPSPAPPGDSEDPERLYGQKLLFVNMNDKGLTPLAGIAFAFIIAGSIFGDSRLVGYSLIGIGVIVAFIDIVKKMKRK